MAASWTVSVKVSVKNTFICVEPPSEEVSPKLRRSKSDSCIRLDSVDLPAEEGCRRSGCSAVNGAHQDRRHGRAGSACPKQEMEFQQACQEPPVHGDAVAAKAAGLGPKDTTILIRNLAHTFNTELLQQALDKSRICGYVFCYVPVNFATGRGLGYGFVVFETHEAAVRARGLLKGFTSWEADGQCLVCEVHRGKMQGIEENVEHYRNSPVMHGDVPDDCKPRIFEGGVRIPFPAPTKKIDRPRLKAQAPRLTFWSASRHGQLVGSH